MRRDATQVPPRSGATPATLAAAQAEEEAAKSELQKAWEEQEAEREAALADVTELWKGIPTGTAVPSGTPLANDMDRVLRRAKDAGASQEQIEEAIAATRQPEGDGTPESQIVAETPAAVEHVGGRVNTEPTAGQSETANPRRGHIESSLGPHLRRFFFDLLPFVLPFVLLILIPIVLVGLIANGWWQDRVEAERKQIESARELQAAEARQKASMKLLNDMASEVNAVTDWATNLAGGDSIAISPVFAVDLQEQWIINRPILFLGELRDVAINQDGTYEILVEHNVRPRFRRNSIRVSLTCSESVATNLIQAAKSNPTTRGGDVAITGTIQRVVTTTESYSERRSITVLTGFGKCISAVYLTERLR